MLNKIKLGPINPSERILFLDVLRGFALFGILLVNMDYFIHPFQIILMPIPESVTGINRAIAWFIKFAAEGKFYTIFSILFAYGFTIMMQRAEMHQVKFIPIILRRYIFLLIIGLIHAFLFWVGDILALYSLLGFILILFRKAKPRTLLIWIIILLVLPLLFTLLGAIGIEMGMSIPEFRQEIEKSFLAQEKEYKEQIQRAYSIYPSGGFFEITTQRFYDMGFMAFSLIFVGLNIFAMFLVGLYLGQKKFFENLNDNTRILKKMLLIGLLIGMIGSFVYATMILDLSRFIPSLKLFTASFFQMIGTPAMSLFYISLMGLIYVKNKNILKFFAAPGRLALTNYLMQTVICTMIFYGYGLGLFGKVNKLEGLILTFTIYIVQIIVSNLWFKKFEFGPVEWLWRKFTYLG